MTTAGSPASATVTSADGLVHASFDTNGTLMGLEFAPTAFERTDPGTLARDVLDTVREGGRRVTQQLDAAPRSAPPPRPTPKRLRPAR